MSVSTDTGTTIPASVSGTYTLDPAHTSLGFVARHAMITKVRGSFTDIAGSITLDVANPTASSATLTMQVASVETGNAQRDEHLRNNDFFDAPKFPRSPSRRPTSNRPRTRPSTSPAISPSRTSPSR